MVYRIIYTYLYVNYIIVYYFKCTRIPTLTTIIIIIIIILNIVVNYFMLKPINSEVNLLNVFYLNVYISDAQLRSKDF